MGIKGLNTFIKRHSPESTKIVSMLKYRGKTFAIDVNILIYKICHQYPNDITSFLLSFLNKINIFLSYGILPIFIFDGSAPIEKRRVINKRLFLKKQLTERLTKLKLVTEPSIETKTQISRLENQLVVVKKEHRESLIELLTILGIPYYRSKHEAEILCSALQKHGVVDYTVTDDTDAFVFGCRKVLKLLKNTSTALLETDLDRCLKDFDLSFNEFVDFCILSGSDYSESIPGINITTVYYIFKRNRHIVSCINELSTHHIIPESLNYIRIREIYAQEPLDEVHEIKNFLFLKPFDSYRFRRFMNDCYHVPMFEIDRYIIDIYKHIREFHLIRDIFFS